MAHTEIVITMSGPELAKGALPDELIEAVRKTLMSYGYSDSEHRWSGQDHKLVYRKMSRNV